MENHSFTLCKTRRITLIYLLSISFSKEKGDPSPNRLCFQYLLNRLHVSYPPWKERPESFFHAPYIPGHRHPQYGFEKRIHLRCSLNQTLVVYVVDDNQSGIPLKYLLLARYKHDCINNFPIIVGFEFPMPRKTPFTSCKLVFRHIHPQKKEAPRFRDAFYMPSIHNALLSRTSSEFPSIAKATPVHTGWPHLNYA